MLSETPLPSLMSLLHNQSLYGHSLSSPDHNTLLFPPALSIEPFSDTRGKAGQRLWHIELILIPRILCFPSGSLQRCFSRSVVFVFPDLFLIISVPSKDQFRCLFEGCSLTSVGRVRYPSHHSTYLMYPNCVSLCFSD